MWNVTRRNSTVLQMIAWIGAAWLFRITDQSLDQGRKILQEVISTPEKNTRFLPVRPRIEREILKLDRNSHQAAPKSQEEELLAGEWGHMLESWKLSSLMYQKALREIREGQKQIDSMIEADAENLRLLEKRAHSVVEALVTAANEAPKIKSRLSKEIRALKKKSDAFQAYWLGVITNELVILNRSGIENLGFGLLPPWFRAFFSATRRIGRMREKPVAVDRQRALAVLTERQVFLKSVSERLWLGDDKKVEHKMLDTTPSSQLSSHQTQRLRELSSQEQYYEMFYEQLSKTNKGLRNIYLNGNVGPLEEEILDSIKGDPWSMHSIIGKLDSPPSQVQTLISNARRAQIQYMLQKIMIVREGSPSTHEDNGQYFSIVNEDVRLNKGLIGDMLTRVQQQAYKLKILEITDEQKRYEKSFENAFELEFQNEVDEEARIIFEKIHRRKVILNKEEFTIWERFLTEADQYMSPSAETEETTAKWFLKLSIESHRFEENSETGPLYDCLQRRQDLSPIQRIQLKDAASAFEELIWNTMADVDKVLFALKYSSQFKGRGEVELLSKVKRHGLTIAERFDMMATLRKRLCPSTMDWMSVLHSHKDREFNNVFSTHLMVQRYLDQNLLRQLERHNDVKNIEGLLKKRIVRMLQDIEKEVERPDTRGIENHLTVETLLNLMSPFTVSASRPQRLLMASTMDRRRLLKISRLHSKLLKAQDMQIRFISKKIHRCVTDSIMDVKNAIDAKGVQYTIAHAAVIKLKKDDLHREIEESKSILGKQDKFFSELLTRIGLKDIDTILFFDKNIPDSSAKRRPKLKDYLLSVE